MDFDNYIVLGRPGKLKLFKKYKLSAQSETTVENKKYTSSYNYVVIMTKKSIFIYKIIRNKN